MVATFRCKQIADKKYEEFIKNEDWLQYDEESRSGFVSRLGEKLDLLIANCLNKYDSEVEDFDSKVRSDARIDLRNKLLQHIRPALQSNLKHLGLQTIQKFREELNTALTKGENLSSASSRCKENYMSQFREHSEGYSNVWNDAIIPEKVSTLNNEFDKYIACVASQKKGGFSFTKIAHKLSLVHLGFIAMDFIAPGVGSSIGHAFGEMFGALGDGIGSAADAMSSGYENAIDEFSIECDNTTLEHGERVANAAHELGEGFGNAAHELGDGVEVAAHELGDGLNHTGDLIEDRVKQVVHAIGGGVEHSSH